MAEKEKGQGDIVTLERRKLLRPQAAEYRSEAGKRAAVTTMKLSRLAPKPQKNVYKKVW